MKTGVLQTWEAGSGTVERDHLFLQPGQGMSLVTSMTSSDTIDKDSRMGGFYLRRHKSTLQQSKNAASTGEKPTSSLSRGEDLVMPRVRLSITDESLASASGEEMGLGGGGAGTSVVLLRGEFRCPVFPGLLNFPRP